jgi:hypothetical protein
MGMVTGEDATEVANPPTTCTSDCQAQNQVEGSLATLGFPAPVPAASRLTPVPRPTNSPPLSPHRSDRRKCSPEFSSSRPLPGGSNCIPGRRASGQWLEGASTRSRIAMIRQMRS